MTIEHEISKEMLNQPSNAVFRGSELSFGGKTLPEKKTSPARNPLIDINEETLSVNLYHDKKPQVEIA